MEGIRRRIRNRWSDSREWKEMHSDDAASYGGRKYANACLSIVYKFFYALLRLQRSARRVQEGSRGRMAAAAASREKMVYNLARTTSIAFTEEPSVCATAASARTCTRTHVRARARSRQRSSRSRDRGGLSTSSDLSRANASPIVRSPLQCVK